MLDPNAKLNRRINGKGLTFSRSNRVEPEITFNSITPTPILIHRPRVREYDPPPTFDPSNLFMRTARPISDEEGYVRPRGRRRLQSLLERLKRKYNRSYTDFEKSQYEDQRRRNVRSRALDIMEIIRENTPLPDDVIDNDLKGFLIGEGAVFSRRTNRVVPEVLPLSTLSLDTPSIRWSTDSGNTNLSLPSNPVSEYSDLISYDSESDTETQENFQRQP